MSCPWAGLTDSNTLELLLPILPLLPQAMFEQDPPLELAFNIDDAPSGMVHSSFRDRGETLGRAGKRKCRSYGHPQ